MKKLMLILAIFFSAGWAVAQEGGGVPEAVMKTFDSLYPKMQGVSWNMRHGNYEANFSSENKQRLIVEIDKNGMLVETEADMPVTALPNNVPMYVIKFYPGVKISKAYTVTKADGTIMYRTEVGEVDLLFDNKGEFVSSEQRDITPVSGEKGVGVSDK